MRSSLRPPAAGDGERSPRRARILLVDDRPENLLALEAVLESLGHELVSVRSGAEALRQLESADFAVVLLDVQMPSMDGFETALRMKQLTQTNARRVPIIFVTANDTDRAHVASGYAHGAVDFVQKPLDADVLRAKVSTFVRLHLANELLVAERETFRRRLQALSDFGLDLSQVRNRSEVADLIIVHGMRLARADTSTLYVSEQKSGAALELLAHRGIEHETVAAIRRITEMGSATALWAESAAEYRALFPALSALAARSEHPNAFWSVPLMFESRPIGVLRMGFHKKRTFADEERAFVATFTEQCAQALQRALLIEREDETRRWLMTTLRSIGDAVLATDTAGHVTFMNPMAERLTGWMELEAQGRPLDEVFPTFSEATMSAVESPVTRVLRGGEVVGLANHTVLRAKNGAETSIDESAAPIRDESGRLLGVVIAFRDVTHEKREAIRREYLSLAGDALVSSLDYRETLSTAARLAVPQLADWCAVDLLEPGSGDAQQVAVAHVDPHKIAFARELRERYPPDPHARTGVPEVIRTGKAELYPHIPTELLEASATDAEHLRIIRELQLDSAMIVPLRAHDRTLGAMTFIYAGSGRRYTETDLAFAEEFARRASIAIENSRALKDAEDARAAERVLRGQAELEIRRRQEAEVERERRAGAEKFIAEAARLFSSSLDYEVTIERVAQLAVPAFADWCMVDLLTDEGESFDRVAISHHRPEGEQISASLKRRYPLRPNASAGVARAVLDRTSQLGRDVGEEFFRTVSVDDDHLRAVRALSVRSYIIAPLVARGRAIGAFSVLSCERNFDEGDLWLVEQLAATASASIDNARLFRAEQRGKHRVDRMQEITAALSRARSATEVAEAACAIGARAVDAVSGALWLLREDGALVLAGAAGSGGSSALIEQFRVIPAGTVGVPALEVVRTGEPFWIESEADYQRVAPGIHEQAARAGHVTSYSAVPLSLGGPVEGVIVFTHPLGHQFDQDERSFYLTLAHHCSQALHRARLLDAERRSNDRLRLLAGAGEALARSLDLHTTLQEVARLAVPAFCDWCVFELVEENETHRIATVHSESEPKVVSSIVVPLTTEGSRVGEVTFATAESGRVYDASDRDFAQDLGRRVEQAISNARLYRAAQLAAERAEDAARRAAEERRRAEDANRIKDEFLATVSHELRTPLNAINGWSALLTKKIDDRASVAKGIDVIRRNAQAQTKIIEDILDVSRIITGKLKIDAVPVDLVEIVRDAIDVVRPSADAKQVALALQAAPDAECLLVADGPRLQQVFWNLLSNAVKFTQAGGRVNVRVERVGASTTVTVTDTGRGIEADFLPHVFERFRQADGSTTRKFGGLGLGLAIVRHIVELHGGNVTAQSAGIEQGSTFKVVLPVRAVAPSTPVEERRAKSDAPTPDGVSASLLGVRILVVDDEPDARELVEIVLTSAGAVVETAGTAREALEALARFRPDVLVSDIGMPGADGYELIGNVRALPSPLISGVPAIALTAYARGEDRARALRAGYDAHITKPVEPTELVATVVNAHGTRQK